MRSQKLLNWNETYYSKNWYYWYHLIRLFSQYSTFVTDSPLKRYTLQGLFHSIHAIRFWDCFIVYYGRKLGTGSMIEILTSVIYIVLKERELEKAFYLRKPNSCFNNFIVQDWSYGDRKAVSARSGWITTLSFCAPPVGKNLLVT